MIVLNFSHALTLDQLVQIEALAGLSPAKVVDVATQFDIQRPFAPQVTALVDKVNLSAFEWQTLPILVIPPHLDAIVATLLAELHGRIGCFPPVARLRQVVGVVPSRFEVAEVINLQAVRDEARARR